MILAALKEKQTKYESKQKKQERKKHLKKLRITCQTVKVILNIFLNEGSISGENTDSEEETMDA